MQAPEKFIDVVCMESQRGEEAGDESSNTSKEHTSTATADLYGEDESSEAEMHQLPYDYQCFENDIQEAV